LANCKQFILDRWEFDAPITAGGDDRFHILAILEGEVHIDGEPSTKPIRRGGTVLLPASAGKVRVSPSQKTVLLDSYLPY
jgi:mannose-6-phosphate isomerase class I